MSSARMARRSPTLSASFRERSRASRAENLNGHPDDRKCARNKDDERLCDQPLLKVSAWRDSPAGGRILDFALLFEGGTAGTSDSETFPRTDVSLEDPAG